MKYIKTMLLMPALLAMAVGATGCNDTWDDHYEAPVEGSDKTIYEAISENPDLSTFKQMIDNAGYAKMLNSTQTFTVWAPVNESFNGFDLNDEALVRRTVLNHLARFNRSTADNSSNGIRMYNGKKMRFDGQTFSGISILSANNLCNNGVLHTMDGVIPYVYNIREYIDSHDETSSIASFLARFDEELFDLENSIPLDVNDKGETVYDSVKIEYNRLLDYPYTGLGPIADEDSTFTMIVPSNKAWSEAYDRIKPWFVTNSDSITDVQTSLAVFQDMVFRQNITDPSGYRMLTSTTGSEYLDITDLFGTSSYINASNGSIWLTDAMTQKPVESWNREIEIESEAAVTRRMLTSTNSYCTTMNVDADSPFADEISEMSYIYISSSRLNNAGAEFTINNPLSGTYKIYAYFVPAIVDNPTATAETTRLQFSVTHPRDANSTRTTTVNYKNNDFLTSPTEVTEMYVGEITFPCSSYVDRLRPMADGYDPTSDESKFKITVQTNVSQTEFNQGTLQRSFRIDRVVLVPVI